MNAESTHSGFRIPHWRSAVIDYTKPWMRPTVYDDPHEIAYQDELTEDVILDADQRQDGLASIHRSEGGRESVKPVGGISKDTTPLRYKRGNRDEVIDLDDKDELQEKELYPDEEVTF
jgi:hypothetical protein